MKISLSQLFLGSLFYLAPIADCLTGILILGGKLGEGAAGSPSQLFRFILMLGMFIYLSPSKKYFFLTTLLIFYFLVVETLGFIFHKSLYGIVIGMVYSSKIVYLAMIFFMFKRLLKKNSVSLEQIKIYFKNGVFISSLFLIIPFILGLGYNTYIEGTFGFKGFFSSGNGLGVFLGCGLLFMSYALKSDKSRYSIIKTIVVLFATLLVGSKTTMICVGISLIYIILFAFNRTTSLTIAILTTIIGVYYFSLIKSGFEVVFDVVLFRYNNTDSVITFLMSERDVYFRNAITNLQIDGGYALRLIAGLGALISFRNPYASYNNIDTLESDFSDLFFAYGIISVIVYLGGAIYLHYQYISKRLFFGIIFTLLILHSVLAGHILFNGMSGILLPAFSLFILESPRTKN
jgi:hypothetical protein